MIHMIEQSGVADRRDADDRLRAVCNVSLEAISTENLNDVVFLRNGPSVTMPYTFLHAPIGSAVVVKIESKKRL